MSSSSGPRPVRPGRPLALLWLAGALACAPAADAPGRDAPANEAPGTEAARAEEAGSEVPGSDALARADAAVSEWVADGRIPGAVLVVTRGDEIVHERAFGAARQYAYGTGQYPGGDSGLDHLDAPVPMTVDTRFDMASVTKVMATTMAVMMLHDRGELDLDAPVSSYLPSFTGGDRDQITPRHLLTHRSGLPQWVPVYYHANDADEALAYLSSLPPAWPVGAERHYSDLGFMLLGRIVEEVSGTRLDVFLERELYGPLGLSHTGFRPAPTAAAERNAPALASTSHGNPFERRMVHDPDFGYRIDGDPDAWDGWRRRTLSGEVNDGNAWHAFGGVAGHAGLFSSGPDLAVLLRLLLDGGEAAGKRFISAGTVASFLASTGDAQALGWQLPPYAPAGSFGHTGFTGTFVLGVPELDLGIVLLTNRQNVGVDDATQYPDVGPLQRAVTAALTTTTP